MPGALEVPQLHIHGLEERSHIRSCHLWSPFPFISCFQRGREGSVHNAPKQKNKNSRESPPQMLARPSARRLSLLNAVKTGKLDKATKGLLASEFITKYKPAGIASPQLPNNGESGTTAQKKPVTHTVCWLPRAAGYLPTRHLS